MSNPYNDQIYTNTYSLWENSRYYDINNLSPQNRTLSVNTNIPTEVFKATRWPEPSETEPPKPPDGPDVEKRRVIERDSLYEDPDTFYKELNAANKYQSTSPPKPRNTPKVWTERYWHKASEAEEGPSKKTKQPGNRIKKQADKTPAQNANMSKAVSMMQKMGWHGGALGRTGDGIVEPVTPNAQYASTKIGLGHTYNDYILKRTKSKKANSIEYFDMNVLLNIYEFVKNNGEIELLFDRSLYKRERKRIHDLVQMLGEDDLVKVNFKTHSQMELVLQICDVNCYVLVTQSSGEPPNRQLCIYKEAPPHVYLIIQDDLNEELPEQAEEKPKEELDIEEETNPFLISITRNLKKQKNPDDSITPEIQDNPNVNVKKVLHFFKQFMKEEQYKELKFLGKFNDETMEGINDFFEDAVRYLKNGGSEKSPFSKLDFVITEDVSGNTVIKKRTSAPT